MIELDKGRKYPKDYKPNIHTASFLVKYYDKKYHLKLMDKKTFPKFRKNIKILKVEKELIVLDDKMEFPSMKMKDNLIKRLFIKNGIKIKFEDFNMGIRDIEIIHTHGHISYEFDETKH